MIDLNNLVKRGLYSYSGQERLVNKNVYVEANDTYIFFKRKDGVCFMLDSNDNNYKDYSSYNFENYYIVTEKNQKDFTLILDFDNCKVVPEDEVCTYKKNSVIWFKDADMWFGEYLTPKDNMPLKELQLAKAEGAVKNCQTKLEEAKKKLAELRGTVK